MTKEDEEFLLSEERLDDLVDRHVKYFAITCGVIASSAFLALISTTFANPNGALTNVEWDRLSAILDVGYIMIFIQVGIPSHLGSELFTLHLVAKHDTLSKRSRRWLALGKSSVNVLALLIVAVGVTYIRSVNKTSGASHFFHVLAIVISTELILLSSSTVFGERVKHVRKFRRERKHGEEV